MCMSRNGLSRVVAVMGVGALLLAVPGGAHASGGGKHCVVGAPGVGDAYYPTYGNGGYEVGHYGLDVAYDPATDRLDGRASIRARAKQSLCSFNLDFVGMTVRSVKVDGRPAAWSRSGQELTITPRHPLRRGHRFHVRVRYDGVPVEFILPGTDIRTGFMTTEDGATVAGQPEVAAAWYPVNDHPLDKAAYTFEVTVPQPYEVVANGFLIDLDRHRETTTWTWNAREPMASYLATIDIGFWDVHRWRTASGIPVYDAVDSAITGGLRAEIDSSLNRQGEILDMLEDAFGPYPFSTVGGIVEGQDDLLFALETQTRPVYSKLFWTDENGDPANGDDVVVHELAHEWFGDDVALARWQDIWLNEGFATYAEWLWEEHQGRGTPQSIAQENYDAIPASDPFWALEIGDPTVDHLFDFPVYLRGAMTVQALRSEVGDTAFWRIIRTWTRRNSGGHGTTPQFIALAERISGQQLDALFDTWLFTATKPPTPPFASARLAAASRSAGAAWRAGAERRLSLLHR
jgi:aminopeptidase N